MSEHLGARVQDALALGALSAADAQRAAAHLASCAQCRAEAETLAAHRAEFEQRVLPRTLPAVRARVEAGCRWWRVGLAAPALALAAVVVGLVVVKPRLGSAPAVARRAADVEPGPDLAIKGGALLQVVARRGDRVWSVADDAVVAAGDSIRFVVGGADATHVMIASLDGRGAATIYHPYGGAESAPLPSGGRVELPGSVVLDDAPGPERIFALFSRRPLRADDVIGALADIGRGGEGAIRAADRLAVGAEDQASVLLEKAR